MITNFKGEYFFLSNFYPCRIPYETLVYPSVEHAFQAAKTKHIPTRLKILNLTSPASAKRAGRSIPLQHFRKDWEIVKINIMYDLLKSKFSTSPLLEMLDNTSPHELIEGNYWGDTFWGVCRGVGENHLGKLLMKVRSEL